MLQDRICKECGCEFTGGPRAYYCPSCRYERQKITNRESKARARKGQTRKLGSIDKCERCGETYTIIGSLQRFCEKCQPIHTKEYDRKTSLEYYHNHKSLINPKRNLRRRIKFTYCLYCGKKFNVYGNRQTCSDECRKNNNLRWQRAYRKKISRVTDFIELPKNVMDLKGQTFGDLTVLTFAGTRNRRAMWKCICRKCNQEVDIMASNLISGRTKSCGCVQFNSEKMRSNNTSGVKGVSWHKGTGKWAAYICINGKQKYIGSFYTLSEAVRARRIAEMKKRELQVESNNEQN